MLVTFSSKQLFAGLLRARVLATKQGILLKNLLFINVSTTGAKVLCDMYQAYYLLCPCRSPWTLQLTQTLTRKNYNRAPWGLRRWLYLNRQDYSEHTNQHGHFCTWLYIIMLTLWLIIIDYDDSVRYTSSSLRGQFALEQPTQSWKYVWDTFTKKMKPCC